jgi:hypothetical protein
MTQKTTRQRLLDNSAQGFKTRVVEIAVEGDEPIKVVVRSPTIAQSTSFTSGDDSDPLGRAKMLARIVISCVRDLETNQPLFTAADEDLILESAAGVDSWVTKLVSTVTELLSDARDAAKN